MEPILELLTKNNDWLTQRLLHYIKSLKYDKYTARLEPILPKAVAGIATSLAEALLTCEDLPEMEADIDYTSDVIILFGTHEAFRHNERRVPVEIYFKLTKYFRQVFLDLFNNQPNLDRDLIQYYNNFTVKYFDRIETGIVKLLTGNQLDLQKAYFQGLFESSPQGIAMLDNSDHIINLNKGFEEMFGYYIDEVKGKNINALIVPGHLMDEGHEVSGKARNGKFVIKETVRKHKDGRLIHVSILGYPIIVNNRQVGIYGIYTDITERKEAEEKLHYLSYHDPLTKLYNRHFFEQQIKRYQNELPKKIAIVVCDIDGLKIVNDTLGHEKGDSLLIAASKVLRKSLRSQDIIARIGGDEFAIFLLDSDTKDVEFIVKRIQHTINEYNSDKFNLPLNVSIGSAVADSKKYFSIHDLFREADNNMYREKLHRGQSTRSSIVQTLMMAMEARDFITEGHSERIQALVRHIAGALKLPDRNNKELQLLAKFHDIGKVGIPDCVLFKEGPLTENEVLEMKRHPEIGYRIAQSSPDLMPISDWILKHHEWWNGTGYPLGLKGEQIPLECRILAIADTYDTITTDRPYKNTMTHEDAIAELKKCAGNQLDPDLVYKIIPILDQFKSQIRHAN